MYFVYILKCVDGKPYTGCTENLEERLERHMNGYVPAAENRRPVQLTSHIIFNDKYQAFEFEKYLKSGEVAERPNAMVLKTIKVAIPS
ncbi:MAG: excinuclease ABC C subunit domain-containing protein [Parcubacteria group bacterium GW2011_GWF2_43_11]|nr:MAG: excinuclease ABC C subunit domain-containing protein [Parcubacteria group bacterium GW2011_GWF2_43_11]